MPADPRPAPSTVWHEALRARDAETHAAEDGWTSQHVVEALELRLAQANAARHALAAAVDLRDRLLNEQRAALRQRDSDVAALRAQLDDARRYHRELASRPLWRRVLGRVRRRVLR